MLQYRVNAIFAAVKKLHGHSLKVERRSPKPLVWVRVLVPVLNNLGKLKMAKVLDFFKDSYVEVTEKVTWPTWSQLQNSAVVVLVASILIALVIFVMDKASSNLLELLYGITS